MKIKTSELTGPALDWAVAKCEWNREEGDWRGTYRADYSTDWSQGGPIIEREMITVGPAKHEGYMAWSWPKGNGFYGDTPLIAAMRRYVSSSLGDEVEIPEELK